MSIGIPDDSSATIYGITGHAVWQAVNTRIVASKTNGSWAKKKVWKPYIGGTSASHSINAINPSTFQSTYYGSPVHNEKGIKFSAGGQYESHGFDISLVGNADRCFSLYINDITAGGWSGCYNGNVFGVELSGSTKIVSADGLNRLAGNGASFEFGSFVMSIFNDEGIIANNGAVITTASGLSNLPSSSEFHTGGMNNGGFSVGYGLGSFYIGFALTLEQLQDEHAAEQIFQTALNRAL